MNRSKFNVWLGAPALLLMVGTAPAATTALDRAALLSSGR